MITMKSKSGSLLALLTLLLTPIACNPATPRPMHTETLTLTIKLYATAKEVAEACHEEADLRKNALGCIRYDLRQGRVLYLKKPRDWCDWGTMKTWGHELMHAMGWRHDEDFEWYWRNGGEWPMIGKNCELLP